MQSISNPFGNSTGTLRINGDPSADINLSLRERDSPVSISPGSKDLVLIKPLDKEGKNGPSSVYVNVICARRHSTDPVSFNHRLHSSIHYFNINSSYGRACPGNFHVY